MVLWLRDKEVGNMTDTNKFKIAMIEAGVTTKQIMESLGITRSALWNKMNNRSDFRQLELNKLFDLLKLDTWEKRQSIFFADRVE
jgi:transcriptional regulator with XRE-family HTH domain